MQARASTAEYIEDLAEAVHFTSRPVEATSTGGAPRSLREALRGILGELLPEAAGAGGGDGGVAGDGGNDAAAACSVGPAAHMGGNGSEGLSSATAGDARAAEAAAEAADPAGLRPRADAAPAAGAPAGGPAEARPALLVGGRAAEVVVGGVRPPLDTPLAWLHAALAHADHFLYVAVLLRT